jgi:hypothetical protein
MIAEVRSVIAPLTDKWSEPVIPTGGLIRRTQLRGGARNSGPPWDGTVSLGGRAGQGKRIRGL